MSLSKAVFIANIDNNDFVIRQSSFGLGNVNMFVGGH
jgi:hypothetical protein